MDTQDLFAEFDKLDDKVKEKCPSCGGTSDNFITKSNEGAQICSNCGTHVSDTLISMKQEWSETGLERCSTVIDPLLVSQSRSVWITGVPYNMIKTHMYHNFYVYKEQGLYDMYKIVDKIGEQNNIPQSIRDHAKKCCKMISGESIKRGKSRIGMIGATIGQAYKQRMNVHLSEDKLATICRVEKKYIQNGIDTLAEFNWTQGIKSEEYLSPRSIENYIEEYMMHLSINEDMIPKISALLERVNPLLPQINNMPSSIAGSCIYYVFVRELKEKGIENEEQHIVKFKKLMKKKCGLNEITVSNCYGNMLKALDE